VGRDVVTFSLDPGVTTGWAIIRRNTREVLGMGDLDTEELGCALDLLVRSMHRVGKDVHPVVEEVPKVGGVQGDLAVTLTYVNRCINHWLEDVFELPVEYVLPGEWKNSRVGILTPPPAEWNGRKLSAHMKDAYLLGHYQIAKTAHHKETSRR